MVNYNNGKIYKIEPICEHEEHEIYIGSTTKQYLSQRMNKHRSDYKRYLENKINYKINSFTLFEKYGLENCQIILLENVNNVNTKDELLAKEAFYIKNNNCLNRNMPLRTRYQYNIDKKDDIREYNKIYHENNKEKFRENYINNKEFILKPIQCECGSHYTYKHKTRHFKTAKHQNFINCKMI